MIIQAEHLEQAYQIVLVEIEKCLPTITPAITTELLLAEHGLIQILKSKLSIDWSKNAMLATFQQHFMVRHSLYRYIGCQQGKAELIWSATAKGLEVRKVSSSLSNAVDESDSGFQYLAGFYGNFDNLQQATEESVSELLASFWTRYHALDSFDESLAALNLEPGSSWKNIQTRYRELAQRHHPDRGGDTERFINIKNAYVNLKRTYQK